MTDLLTFGETMLALRQEDPGPLRLGGQLRSSIAGAEATVAIGAARLGHDTAWCGRIGADDAGTLVLSALRGSGVDTRAVVTDPDAPTGLLIRLPRTAALTRVNYYRSGSAGSRLRAADLAPALVRSPKVVHTSGITAALGVRPPRAEDPGWVAACGTGIALLDEDGHLDWLARPEDGARTRMRMNDGCADPRGRFLAGSMAYDGTPGAGALYRVDIDGSVERILDGLTIPNGPVFSPDGSVMYLADSARRQIFAYDYDTLAGALGPAHLFAELGPQDGAPDGMAVETHGHLWSSEWGAARLRRYSPDGQLVQTLPLPATQPTSCAFGGPHGTDLFITTATYQLAYASPWDGRTLVHRSQVAGVPAGAARIR
ncbi:PfkB family carbohydrate kinase [Streptomyces sp. RB6PN25]|uniref:PfkB family carbohydrate kinase n=1 Tax=Streptomyces humicola TaxID=2953240 RepID=A0ABT1Q638_9ACTN|nr:PfkB family carbohydrate kinase [Streptomyces humicola]MCQ4084835.1 PfkB family carbohydrate kinase [Streptomyces humicola]